MPPIHGVRWPNYGFLRIYIKNPNPSIYRIGNTGSVDSGLGSGISGMYSSRRAGGRIPSGSIGLLAEVGASDERHVQVLRVLDDGRDDQPGVAVRLHGAAVVF